MPAGIHSPGEKYKSKPKLAESRREKIMLLELMDKQ